LHEVLDAAADWYRQGEPFALVHVVRVFGSAPRRPGVAMAVATSGEVVGSVSGGCIEGAVYEECLAVLESQQGATHTYGVSDDDAFAVGLTCGGDIDVYIEPVDRERHPAFLDVVRGVRVGEPVALVTVVRGESLGEHAVVTPAGTAGQPSLVELARSMLERGETGLVGDDVFVESFPAPARLIVFGATDFARALVSSAKLLGFHVTICDARPVFATRTRFPDADEVVVDQPYRYLQGTTVDSRTVLCVLTHDPKFDVPLLEVALRSPVGYIGALGSRRTHDDRLARLRAAGMSDDELGRLRSPIGLDLGASTPQETAISILAEVIATRRNASGRPLASTDGPIHS